MSPRCVTYLITSGILALSSAAGVGLSLWISGSWMPGLPFGVLVGLALGGIVAAVRRHRDLSA